MHRVVKVILVFLILALCLLSVIVLGDESYRHINDSDRQLDYTILIAIPILLLGIPSCLFQIHTLKHLRNRNSELIIDSSEDILDNIYIKNNPAKIHTLLWICDLLYGLSFFSLGVFLLYFLITESTNDDPTLLTRAYTATGIVLIFGILLLADEWIMKKKFSKANK